MGDNEDDDGSVEALLVDAVFSDLIDSCRSTLFNVLWCVSFRLEIFRPAVLLDLLVGLIILNIETKKTDGVCVCVCVCCACLLACF